MSYCKLLSFLLPALLMPLLATANLPEGIQQGFQSYFSSREYLLQGGSAIFDDCVIAVGSAANTPDANVNTMRSLALADANSNLITAIYGAIIKANQEIKESNEQKGDTLSASSEIRSIYRAIIENRSLTRSQVCGEWVSTDQKTYFVAVARFFNKEDARHKNTPASTMPAFVQDFQAFGNWQNALLSVRGILRGGAALYFDEYSEEYLITVASAPKRLPYSNQLEMLQIKAGAEAIGYVNGNFITDRRYLEENLNSAADGNTYDENDDEIIRKHIQTSVRQGAIRRITPIGTWNISDNPKRTFRAFALRLSDVAMETFPVIPAGADENSDTVEISTADGSGKMLSESLKKAEFYENDNEISVVVPDNSPIFAQNEEEIELTDPAQNLPSPGVKLQPAEKITPANPLPIPSINFSPEVNINVENAPAPQVPQVNVVNVNQNSVPVQVIREVRTRGYVPVRVYHRHTVRPKKIVIRRHRHHFHRHPHVRHHGPRLQYRKMQRPPKFHVRAPRPGKHLPRTIHQRHSAPRRHITPAAKKIRRHPAARPRRRR